MPEAMVVFFIGILLPGESTSIFYFTAESLYQEQLNVEAIKSKDNLMGNC